MNQIKRVYPKGAIIIKQGDYGDEAFQLISGSVEVGFISADGNKTILAILRPPHMFGEMALIDEKPRSATVTALTDVEVAVTQKSAFVRHFSAENESPLIPVLRTMFERLRTTNQVISALSSDISVVASAEGGHEFTSPSKLTIKPTTEAAKSALGAKKFDVKEFPFRIGRQEVNDVLGINDLMLHDSPPYQVSPHHLLISLRNNVIELSDRGSRYGSLISGVRVGLSNRSKVVDLKRGDNEVILGDIYSRIRFNFVVD
ncbi:MAG: cyclic nucleotide-binding domain-containing protein [Bacteroidetes bacterium]|nr:cyclic nucleotide-binding domain-containing protein [Bacteroidota bacterium]